MTRLQALGWAIVAALGAAIGVRLERQERAPWTGTPPRRRSSWSRT